MSQTVTTSDIYESVYYVLNRCELTTIQGMEVNGKMTCQLTFSGGNINSLQIEYFHGKAQVNLLEFRRMYSTVIGWVTDAKRKLKHELQEQRRGGRA